MPEWQHHPHVHCVVPGGGLAPDYERWIGCKAGFFLPVRVLSRLFRRLFLEALEDTFYQKKLQFFGETEPLQDAVAFHALTTAMENREWVVYAKPPFGGAQQALEYLGRYTHRVAISNERLVAVKDGAITFQWKDYRHKQKHKWRCAQHSGPPGTNTHRFRGLVHRTVSSAGGKPNSRSRSVFAPPSRRNLFQSHQSYTDQRGGFGSQALLKKVKPEKDSGPWIFANRITDWPSVHHTCHYALNLRAPAGACRIGKNPTLRVRCASYRTTAR